jgi:hypothetical protein
LRSRPPARGQGDEIFKIYLLMREKERDRQFRNVLNLTLQRSLDNDELIDRRLEALVANNKVADLFGPPSEADEASERDAGPSRPTCHQAEKSTKAGPGEFRRTVVRY